MTDGSSEVHDCSVSQTQLLELSRSTELSASYLLFWTTAMWRISEIVIKRAIISIAVYIVWFPLHQAIFIATFYQMHKNGGYGHGDV